MRGRGPGGGSWYTVNDKDFPGNRQSVGINEDPI